MQRRQHTRRDRERGSTLLIVLVLMSALAAIAAGMGFLASTETVLTSNDVQDRETFYLAEAAVEEAVQYLNTLGEPFLGASGSQPVKVIDNAARMGVGNVTVYLDPKDANSGQSTRFVQISARATHNNGRVSKALTMTVGQQNFSRYAYFSDLEVRPDGSKIWFMSADELFGPVHSNDMLHISGNPIFHAQVSSSADSVDYQNGGPPSDNPDFQQGLELGVDPIPLPQDLAVVKAKAQTADGLYVTGMTTAEIEIIHTGSKSQLRIVKDGGAPQIVDLPVNGTVYVNGKVRVKGHLEGRLTIASLDDMYIDDNVVYHTDPRTNPSSTDVLGLISEKNVIVAATTANMDSGDETIMAAVMALGESFMAENHSSGPPRGKLKLYGGIIQKRRGYVSTFNSGGIVSGYAKAYDYDARLADTPPPTFPTTGIIERMTWREIDPSTDISQNHF